MSKFIDAIHEHRRTIEDIALELAELSRACGTLGLDNLSINLNYMKHTLLESSKELSESFSDDLSNQLRAARENSCNVLNAVMAGIEIGKEDVV